VTSRPRQLQATLVTATLLVGAAGSGLIPLTPYRKGHDFDLVASALPATPRAAVTDTTAVFVRARAKQVKADASAVASATCNSCSGRAIALQVIYLDKARTATADNTATAWSRCRGCRASSVSVQVVVMRPSTQLAARNRALAVNASCKRCAATRAIAVQRIVVTKDRRTLSERAQDQLKVLATQFGAELSGTAITGLGAAIAKSQAQLSGIDDLISAELRPTSVQRHLDVHVG
jgi:hypothetical protein